MTKYVVLIWFAFVLMATSCAITDMDPRADFSHYRTFAWGTANVEVKNPLYRGGLIDKEIKRTVESEFASRGISFNKKNPDFVVSYQTYTENKQGTYGGGAYGYPYYPYGYYRFGWWGMPYYGYGTYPQNSYSYTEGTLIIDITDKQTNELVWRGSVKGKLSATGLRKQIDKGVKAIMKKYPVIPQQQLTIPDRHAIGE
jgi:hypothetical protein